jgi:hypothetical protein
MELVESSGSRRVVWVIITIALAFFAVVAAVWITFDKAERSAEGSFEDGYEAYEEKTKEEVLVDIQAREAAVLNQEDVEQKQAILESIRRE